MRRFLIGTVVTTAFASIGSGVALGQPRAVAGWWDTSPAPNSVKGARCGMPINEQRTRFVTTTDMSARTPADGRIVLVCHAEVTRGSMRPFHQTGFACAVGPEGTTTASRVVWTSSGKGTLTCHGDLPD